MAAHGIDPPIIRIFIRQPAENARLRTMLEYFGLSETIYSVTSQPLLYFAGREEIAWLAVTLGIVLVLPNTQIWTRHFRPVIDHVELSAAWPRALTWTPSTAWSMFVLVLAAVAIVSALQPTEFLYWQF